MYCVYLFLIRIVINRFMINLCVLKVSGRVFCINFFLFFGEGGGGFVYDYYF